MNFAEFSSKSHSSSTMSLELAFPGEMFIMQESDVNINTNRIDSNNQLQDFKQTTGRIESFGTANLGDQIHKYQKVVFKNKSKPTKKLQEPKNAGKLRSPYSQFQIDALNFEYQKNNKYVTIPERKEIARKLDLSENQVKNWFQNKRTKEKRDEKRKLASKKEKELPPITTFSSISQKHIRENFYSLCWSEEKSLTKESPSEQSGSLSESIIPSITPSQDASTSTDNFLLPNCPGETASSNNFHLNSSSSLTHSLSGDTSSLSLQMADEPNNNINSLWYQNDFTVNMPPLSSPQTVSSNHCNTTSFLSIKNTNNNVPSSPWVMQQALANPDIQYFNQWVYPFYSYWPQNQQFIIKQEKPDDFHANSQFQNNEQLINNCSQRFEYQQNFDQLGQFPLDFINSYDLGNHFLNL